MQANSAALAAIGRANIAFCEQCVGLALQNFERAQWLNVAAYEAFWARLMAGAEAIAAVGASAMARGVLGSEAVGQWAHIGGTFGELPQGLPGLVAEYAADMGDSALAQTWRRRAVPRRSLPSGDSAPREAGT